MAWPRPVGSQKWAATAASGTGLAGYGDHSFVAPLAAQGPANRIAWPNLVHKRVIWWQN